MKPVKVLYIVYSSKLYGDNISLLNILEGITKMGIVPYVVLSSSGTMRSILEEKKIDTHIIRHHFSIYPPYDTFRNLTLFIPRLFRMILQNYRATLKLVSLVKSINPHLIHTNVGPIHIGYKVARKLKVPHVWHVREYQDLGFEWHPFPSNNVYKARLNSDSNFPIAITQGIYNHYLMGNNARIIYDGVVKKNGAQLKYEKEKYFLFVGRLEKAKGIKSLIRAFIELCNYNDDFILKVAGDGEEEYKSGLLSLCEKAGISERVQFLGFRTDVLELMSKAHSLIVPSRFEGFGFITVEAMYSGCLVIGYNKGGTREILEKENLGFLYTTQEELVTIMFDVSEYGLEVHFPKIRLAQQRAVELYSIERNQAEIREFYSSILEGKIKSPYRS